MFTPIRWMLTLMLCAMPVAAQSSLEVVAAYYGFDRSFVDVTSLVRAQAQPDGVALTVGGDPLGGDPFPGQLKTLRIYYKLSGQFQNGEWKDGESLLIGRLPAGGRNSGVRGGGRGTIDRTGRTLPGPLTVLKATYGAGDRTVDVTTLVQSRVQGNSLQFDVPGTQLGDPAPNVLKELVVTYQYAGQTREVRARDGQRLRAPGDMSAPPAPPPPTGLKIISAQYGASNRIVDVSALLANRVASDRLVVLVENNNMGGDPLRGADKVLNVVYEWNGQRYTASAKEGQTLRLPPDQVVASQPAAPRIPTDGVCFYPSPNFEGTPMCAALGQDQANVNGVFGSVKLLGTVRQLELFEAASYSGRTLRLTADLADLSRATSGFFGTPVTWATKLASFRMGQ